MPRPVRPWFRVYVEMIGDRKIRRLTPTQRWTWVAILAAARESPEPGRLLIAEGVAMTTTELASFADVKEKDVRATLTAAAALGMVGTEDGGVIAVTNWDVRQFETDNVTARTRAHRKERSNDVPSDDVGTFQPRSREQGFVARRNAPETETETEAESKQRTSSVVALPRNPTPRATAIPPDWTPGPELIDWARTEGIPDEICRRELPIFRDYWWGIRSTTKGRKTDWPATWRNWVRRANTERPPSAGRPRAQQDTDDLFDRAATRMGVIT